MKHFIDKLLLINFFFANLGRNIGLSRILEKIVYLEKILITVEPSKRSLVPETRD